MGGHTGARRLSRGQQCPIDGEQDDSQDRESEDGENKFEQTAFHGMLLPWRSGMNGGWVGRNPIGSASSHAIPTTSDRHATANQTSELASSSRTVLPSSARQQWPQESEEPIANSCNLVERRNPRQPGQPG